MFTKLTLSLAMGAGFAAGVVAPRPAPEAFTPAGFVVEHEVLVDATPEVAFDKFTGDVLPWWDHHYSEAPKSLEIQPVPGGHFIEWFDDEGNGAIHADVTAVTKGSEIHFTGRLGFALANVNLQMTHRVKFEAEGDGTRVSVDVHGVGEAPDGTEQIVQRVWQHFLSSRFKPYVEGTLGD